MSKWLFRWLHKPIYEARVSELIKRVSYSVRRGDSLLDVGCGGGELGVRLGNELELKVEGVERFPREGCRIGVTQIETSFFPFPDNAFDHVLVADVLHHEWDDDILLKECLRVCRKSVIIKDHKLDGVLAIHRIALMDWLANTAYGVECIYRYRTCAGWHHLFSRLGAHIVSEITSMRLYPTGVNWLFGGRLQYFAVIEPTQAECE
ncbi:MAG: class I SAM-dependent methyltransferase [Verrucomicrobiae bacterium]|nr:class I SAM-dependent methyltransferase [Verrucomicrobiae bacterium]